MLHLKAGLLDCGAHGEIAHGADRLANHPDESRILEVNLEYGGGIGSLILTESEM
jgi:hypothetical protein